ncbi:MAG: sigma 54-interacting transcriptional regulator [Myxococcota bacterium]
MSDSSATVPHSVKTMPIRSLRVEVVKGPDAGKSMVAESDTLSIGCAPGNNLVLSDDTVSRYHLELRRVEDRILVEDHGSTNGTVHGSLRVDRGYLLPGAQLVLGKTTLRVDDGGGTVDLELNSDGMVGMVRGRSPEMRRLLATVERISKTDAPVLLLGETGTGKEVIAHAIHESSPRANKPFETVDCGTLLPTLIASELFGHEKGAFTGADRQHVGAFERAEGGTLFLDEIGELPLQLQATLLGVLERKSFRRVGGNKAIPADVRIIGATHRDLRSEVNQGNFREDLYYRLAVVLMRIPPLRERTEDIAILVEHFLREAGHDGAVEEIISESSIASLSKYHWPGNVRELRNFVEAALAIGEAPQLSHTERPPLSSGGSFPSVPITELIERPYKGARELVLHEFEQIYLSKLLERCNNNMSHAAREAKIDRSYLIQMAKRIGLR